MAVLVTCAGLYLLANFATDSRRRYELKPIHTANAHPQLGIMENIEDFWTPEKSNPSPKGPGLNGEPVQTSPEDEQKKDQAYREYGFNQFISDKISLDRTIKDTRHPA